MLGHHRGIRTRHPVAAAGTRRTALTRTGSATIAATGTRLGGTTGLAHPLRRRERVVARTRSSRTTHVRRCRTRTWTRSGLTGAGTTGSRSPARSRSRTGTALGLRRCGARLRLATYTGLGMRPLLSGLALGGLSTLAVAIALPRTRRCVLAGRRTWTGNGARTGYRVRARRRARTDLGTGRGLRRVGLWSLGCGGCLRLGCRRATLLGCGGLIDSPRLRVLMNALHLLGHSANHGCLDRRGRRTDEFAHLVQSAEKLLTFQTELFSKLVDTDLGH